MKNNKVLWPFRVAVSMALLAAASAPIYGQVLGSFSSQNTGGSGTNSDLNYTAQIWLGDCISNSHFTGASGTCFEAGAIAINAGDVGVPDVITSANNANFSTLAGFFTSVPGASIYSNIAMGNGGSSTNFSTVASKFGNANPPFPGDIVTGLTYTLTSITQDTPTLVSFHYSFEVDGTTAAPEPGSIALFGAGIGGMAFFGLRRRYRRS